MSRKALCLLGLCIQLSVLGGSCKASDGDGANSGYDLSAGIKDGDTSQITQTLKVGGELISRGDDGAVVDLPLSVDAKLDYQERVIRRPGEAERMGRSLRRYSVATATIKIDDGGVDRTAVRGVNDRGWGVNFARRLIQTLGVAPCDEHAAPLLSQLAREAASDASRCSEYNDCTRLCICNHICHPL